MIIKITSEEEKNLVIFKVKNKILSDKYLEDRDKAWEELKSQGEGVGKQFWNGKLCSFEGFSQIGMNNPVIYLGEMEYKDRLFKKKNGVQDIIDKYGKDHLMVHCGLSVVIITKDKRFVVGRKRRSLSLKPSILAHVSGNLNIDEMEISKMEDIYKFLVKEIKEEINLDVQINELRFTQINIFNSYCNFDFVYYIDMLGSEIKSLTSSDEFESFEALSLEEILELKEEGIPDFEFSKRYLKELIKE